MSLRRYGTFTGGIDLPDEKADTLDLPVAACAPLKLLAVPLAPCGTGAARPLVGPGQRVAAGQRIAAAAVGDGSVDVFAPLDGRVSRLTTACVAAGDGFVQCPAVEIDDLSSPPPPLPQPRATRAWTEAGTDELLAQLAAGQLVTLRRRPVPLAAWLDRARRRRCRTLIANLMEHEPYVTADHRLLVERPAEVLEGLAVLARALEARRVYLAADRRRTGRYEAAADAAERFGIDLIALPHKYPMGADTILAKVLTRREAAPGADTTSVGAAVIDAATCLAVYHWAACETRTTGRVVTLAGPGVEKPANLYVPFGASCAELLGAAAREALVVHGGPMAGLPLAGSAVVAAATGALVALPPERAPAPGPCIRCGWCTDHCPARLNVAALNDAFELALVARAAAWRAEACVACGVCSYVCPARLPLTQRIGRLKRRLAPAEESAAPPPDAEESPARLEAAPAAAPFLRAPEGARTVFLVTMLAAAAPLLGGLVLFGWRAGIVVALSAGSCAFVERLYYRVTRAPSLLGRSHGVLTGLLLGLTLPAFVPWYVPVVAGAFAVLVGKAVFGGVGHFVWQPALVGRLAVTVLLPAQLTVASAKFAAAPAPQPFLARGHLLVGDVTSAARAPDGLSWRTETAPEGAAAFLVVPPAAMLRGLTDRSAPRYGALVYVPEDLPNPRPAGLLRLPPLANLLHGARPGGIGETSVVLVIVAGLYLVYRNFVKWQLPFAFVAAAAAAAAVAPIYLVGPNDVTVTRWLPIHAVEGLGVGVTYVSYQLLATELLLAAFFLATEMTSRPVGGGSQVVFAAGCGIVGMLLHLYTQVPTPFFMGVLAMNTFTPTLDRLWRPRVFGTPRLAWLRREK